LQKYNVIGMSCAACSSAVEKAVSSLDGVRTCNVNLLTNSMIVDGTASNEQIILAVQKAGYGASLVGEKKKEINVDFNETKKLKYRLISSLFFLSILMYEDYL